MGDHELEKKFDVDRKELIQDVEDRKEISNHNNNNNEEDDGDNADNVALHYNARPQGNVKSRKFSPIFKMRSFNNAVKTILINKFTKPGSTVLDFGCGKGGDLQKWDRARVRHVVGVDIAKVSIDHAIQRYQELTRRSRLNAEFYVADLFVEDINKVIDSKDILFDVVSCQFMLHYSFEVKSKAIQCMSNITERLRKGGIFIGTIPNSSVLFRKLKEAEGLEFGNDIYKIRFDQKTSFDKYGHRYHFYLKDAIDDCPEYLMHFESFKKMVEGYGFKMIFAEGLHDFYRTNQQYPKCRELFERMKLTGNRAGLSDDEWEATGLYLAFAFQKI